MNDCVSFGPDWDRLRITLCVQTTRMSNTNGVAEIIIKARESKMQRSSDLVRVIRTMNQMCQAW